jgi:tripartite-type tricarboxylate transporter receptor subunit TctC
MRALVIGLIGLVPSIFAAASLPATAQDYPNRPVTIVAPSAPGGLYSLFSRLIGSKFEQRLGKPFVVENRPGAGSIVGMQSVARAPGDGYTLMVVNSTGMAANVTLHKTLPYDPMADFVPVGLLALVPEVLVVNAALPIHSIADLTSFAKQKGNISFGSAGAGTTQHISGEMLNRALGINMTHVPYKGMAPALNDLTGGHIEMMFSPIPNSLPLIQSGKLRMLGVNTTQRLEAIPDARPLSELGIREFDVASWFMLVAPAKTPPAIIDRLHAELRGFINDPDVRQEYVKMGLVPVDSESPEKLKSFVQAEIARWGDIVRSAGLAGME